MHHSLVLSLRTSYLIGVNYMDTDVPRIAHFLMTDPSLLSLLSDTNMFFLDFYLETQRTRPPGQTQSWQTQAWWPERNRVRRQGALILFDLALFAAGPESAIFFLDGLRDGSLGLTTRVGSGGVARALYDR